MLQSFDVWANLDNVVLLFFYWAAVLAGLYAFTHAVLQRADAYTAVDRLTKPAWVGITGGAAALLLLNAFVAVKQISRFGQTGLIGYVFFYLIALVAVLIYLVDVKPAVTEVQRGPRW